MLVPALAVPVPYSALLQSHRQWLKGNETWPRRDQPHTIHLIGDGFRLRTYLRLQGTLAMSSYCQVLHCARHGGRYLK